MTREEAIKVLGIEQYSHTGLVDEAIGMALAALREQEEYEGLKNSYDQLQASFDIIFESNQKMGEAFWLLLNEQEERSKGCHNCYGNDMAIDAVDNPCWNCKGDHSEWMEKPTTNADRIRAMSDEDLARFLTWNVPDCANYCDDARCGCKWNCKTWQWIARNSRLAPTASKGGCLMELKPCPFCGGCAELAFKIPVYGAGGCEIKCISCRAKVHDFGFTEQHFDEEKRTLSTPATINSISGCIERAIEAWNRRVGEGEKE